MLKTILRFGESYPRNGQFALDDIEQEQLKSILPDSEFPSQIRVTGKCQRE
jgi:hypothetical protein